LADGEIKGMAELIDRFSKLPTRLRRSVLRGWATAQGNRMAARLRPMIFAVARRTGRLTGSIRGAAVRSPKGLSIFKAIARAIAYSSRKHGGELFNPLTAGTAPRYTKGGVGRNAKTGRFEHMGALSRALGGRAYRGRIAPRRFMERFGPNVHAMVDGPAQDDLAKRIDRALRKNGGG
jgi:hypothetical protein